ncbi:hypothetical protein HDE68_003192 [Pedobacter cryoconitis]|uniref:Uncharacterized protein n=1 Tax=Pedobacter cryoconitis TaxID=188932 RepID=A0A7W8ZNI2_9SPHI|nr:hypothetical protein [Pedobacter cryoconitis]MBB5637279.1 hypothetical protein [Pedobacter cryoconitis]
MLQSENKQVKYKSNKILDPVFILWFIAIVISAAYNKLLGVWLAAIFIPVVFGVAIYRANKLKKNKDVLLYTVFMIGTLILLLTLILTKSIKL